MVTLDTRAARTQVAEALRIWRELGDTWWIAVELELEALIMTFQQECEPALADLEEGVALARQLADPWPLATCLIRFGDALKPLGRAAEARPYLEEGVALARGIGDRILLSEGLRELGSANYADGNLTLAASLTEEALANGRAIGSMPHIFLGLFQSIVVACMQGDPEKARRYLPQILSISDISRSTLFGAAFVLACFGLAECFFGDPGKGVPVMAAAFRLIGQASGMNMLSAGDDPTIKVARQALEIAQARLGPEAFQAAWAEGQRMTVEQAMAVAASAIGEPASDNHAP